MTEITMPKLSDTMTEGRIVSWKKAVGDTVSRGEIIAEVETDKATMELEAFGSGTLQEICVKTNELVPVGTVIGLIGESGEMVTKNAVPVQTTPVLPVVQEIPQQAEPQPVQSASQPELQHRYDRAAPVVRRRARELGIDLDLVAGSSPGGRILMSDLDLYMRSAAVEKQELVEKSDDSPQVGEVRQSLSRMRKGIAASVTDSWRNIPHFYVTMEIMVEETEEIRRELKILDEPVSLNDMIIKAAAHALRKFPLVNATYSDDGIAIHDQVHIGFAVSLPDGLLVPVIRDCDRLTLKEITLESTRLAQKARDGQITEGEISGGTFTISNLGMFGVKEFSAIIFPTQAAILAVGAVVEKVIMKGDRLAGIRTMLLTLSADHRVLDGAYAAHFLDEVKTVLENPVQLLL